MKKLFRFYSLIWLVMIVCFNLLVFLPPVWTTAEKYTPSFWIGYAFITFAFLLNLAFAYVALTAKSAQKLFYNIPLIKISYASLITSFIVGGVFMLIPAVPHWVAITVCAGVLAFYAIALIKASAAINVIDEIDSRVKSQTSFVKNLTFETENLVSKAQNVEIKAICKKIFEAVRYSDPMSQDSLSELEAKIIVQFDDFKSAVEKNKEQEVNFSSSELLILLEERNRMCKLLKN